MATVRLFDSEPYRKEAFSDVVSCEKTEHNGICYAVILKETIFFPEEGGQSPDKGTIDDIPVLDVQVSGQNIVHYLASPLKEGAHVHLLLDWNHRFSNMQQHSGEHIFSGLVHSTFGYENVGFHLSDNSVTMDFNGVLNAENLALIEKRANEAIFANIPIEAGYVDKETLKTLEYRSKKELSGDVRIVKIEGYDTCACCAPHVRRTGEIGMLKIIHSQSYKGGVRIHILCGMRALMYYRESIGIIDSLTTLLTTGRENLKESTEKLKTENQSLSSKLLSAKQELLFNELSDISGDIRDVLVFKDKTDAVIMKNAVNFLTERHKGLVGFFSGDENTGYSYILASKTEDVRNAQGKLKEAFSAKGGGKSEMVQGSVNAKEIDIRNILK